jgi:hypothetical protein
VIAANSGLGEATMIVTQGQPAKRMQNGSESIAMPCLIRGQIGRHVDAGGKCVQIAAVSSAMVMLPPASKQSFELSLHNYFPHLLELPPCAVDQVAHADDAAVACRQKGCGCGNVAYVSSRHFKPTSH